MTRLNVSIRKLAGTDAELANLITRRADLAEAIRVDALGGSAGIEAIAYAAGTIKTLMACGTFDKVQGFRIETAAKRHELVKINLGGMRVTLQYSGLINAWVPGKEVYKSPVPISSTINHPADHKFTLEFLSIESDYKAVHEKRDGLRLQVLASLEPFTTVKKLLAAWPEAAELLPDNMGKAAAKLPVIMTKDLNCLIGLPQE